MKHHLSALKGSSATGCQSSLSSDTSRVKRCRARSVSGSFQEVRFSFLKLQRRGMPCILRWTSSSLSSSVRPLRHKPVSVRICVNTKRAANPAQLENPDCGQTSTKITLIQLELLSHVMEKICIKLNTPGEVRQLQQVSTQEGEHCHPQLSTADLMSQSQVGQAVVWAEFICQD